MEREVLKYRKWGKPFFPLRFLNLLPLSHMFGQAMATFIPPMLPGVVVFMRDIGYVGDNNYAHRSQQRAQDKCTDGGIHRQLDGGPERLEDLALVLAEQLHVGE